MSRLVELCTLRTPTFAAADALRVTIRALDVLLDVEVRDAGDGWIVRVAGLEPDRALAEHLELAAAVAA